MAKILIAMSGGVDSSLTAALLQEQGHEIAGITMKVWYPGGSYQSCDGDIIENNSKGSLTLIDAAKVADFLKCEHHILDCEKFFKENIVNSFVEQYSKGKTPNPCVICNNRLKFGKLLEKTKELGCDKLATGHYARVQKGQDGKYKLLRAKDMKKDQTYFLYRRTQRELARVLFPLGEIIKEETRRLAAERKLPVANKDESQDICFIPNGDYGSIVSEINPQAKKPGDIVTRQGEVVGSHKGLAFYTVGQRRGLNVAVGEPVYVLELDTISNRIIIGKKVELEKKSVEVSDLHWISGNTPLEKIKAMVKIRSAHTGAEAEIIIDGNNAKVQFDEPQIAVAPGQAAVFYQGDECLGGGVIEG